MKKAFIFDLDNTIFPVPSIGEKLFEPLFSILLSTKHAARLPEIKYDVMRKPFQWVAEKFGFDDQLRAQATELLKTLEYQGEIKAFDDFQVIRKVPVDKFLVTTGFTKMQRSKIDRLQLDEFREKIVIDPSKDPRSKKDVFSEIIERYRYHASEVLIIGDDPDSEIRAGIELGVETVLMDRHDRFRESKSTFRIRNYLDLLSTGFMD